MKKLALIGKNISHSLSPKLYQKLISADVNYSLLDVKSPEALPSLDFLAQNYDGVNITSPYKEAYLEQVQLTEAAQKIRAINCLKFMNGRVYGDNTDYYAVKDILEEVIKQNGQLFVVVLGDGVMSRLLVTILEELRLSYVVLSRKKTKDFIRLDLERDINFNGLFPLIVNTCSREYSYSGNFPAEFLFWDFNYNFEPHRNLFIKSPEKYLDGLSMLEKQAEYAVVFWSSKT